jgi:hypothetical protein
MKRYISFQELLDLHTIGVSADKWESDGSIVPDAIYTKDETETVIYTDIPRPDRDLISKFYNQFL